MEYSQLHRKVAFIELICCLGLGDEMLYFFEKTTQNKLYFINSSINLCFCRKMVNVLVSLDTSAEVVSRVSETTHEENI